MYEYIKGMISEVNPTFIVLENNGIAYFIKISLSTYTKIGDKKNCKLYLHQIIKEDCNDLFGFYDESERNIFRYLISVSGIGANIARVMLSSFSAEELQQAIFNGNVDTLKSIKGIGIKTAQRVVLDLKDKIGEPKINKENSHILDNSLKNEALSALVTLGFNKIAVEKVLKKILLHNNDLNVEELIKQSLQRL